MRKNHDFNFFGGDQLSRMSASWLVSYMADETGVIPNSNWKNLKSQYLIKSRISKYNKTRFMHRTWLVQVTKMNEKKLDTNTIGLTGDTIKQWAVTLLSNNR